MHERLAGLALFLFFLTSTLIFVNYKFKNTSSAFKSISYVEDFNKLCLKKIKNKKECNDLLNFVSHNSDGFKVVSAKEFDPIFNIAEYPTDSKTLMIMIGDPNLAVDVAYCYFQFRKWFDPSLLSPIQFLNQVSGFAILKSEIEGFDGWLKKEQGLECSQKTLNYFRNSSENLKKFYLNYEAIIAVNIYSLLNTQSSYEEVMSEIAQTFNHERIHVAQVMCPELEHYAQKKWQELSEKNIIKLKTDFPYYDWNSKLIAVRENLAITYERLPYEFLKLINFCNFKN